jgi:hypothetical protein
MESPTPRRLSCAHCGTSFDCGLGGECWCAAEQVRLPVPKLIALSGPAEDCLCLTCLRAAAHADID